MGVNYSYNMRDLKQLIELQSLPLDIKIQITQQRIKEWVSHYGEDRVAISFSGGKDSTVLMDIVRESYPGINGVFFDTGLEFPEIRSFVKTFSNVEWIKPEKNFKQVIYDSGYPFISKEVAHRVSSCKSYFVDLINQYNLLGYEIQDNSFNKIEEAVNILSHSDILASILKDRSDKRLGGANVSLAILLGMFDKQNNICCNPLAGNKSKFSKERYKFLLYAPFKISGECCDIMKKKLSHNYTNITGKKFITAQMAIESRIRMNAWIKNGCNAFNATTQISNPMSFWTEQDVLQYVKKKGISIAPVYGDIIEDSQGKYITTGCNRTGCMYCGFGCHRDTRPNRFELIDIFSKPETRNYVMRGGEFSEEGFWVPSSDGLGYWFLLKWISIHGSFDIFIPDFDMYEKEYGNDTTRYYLYRNNE